MNPRKTAFCGFVLALAGAASAAAATTQGIDRPAVAGDAIPQTLQGQELRPLSLASGDFDGDGTADLAAGYATADGRGVVLLYRGNVDAVYPHSPEARRRRTEGVSVGSPFLSTDRALALTAPPDFLVAGDFDADGRADLASASRGARFLDVHPGDGEFGFGEARPLALPGALTALAAGDVGQRDGLADLVAAVDGPAGFAAVVHQGPEGALRSPALRLRLAERAAAIETGAGELGNAIDLRSADGGGVRIERASGIWAMVDAGADVAEKSAAPHGDAAAVLRLRVVPDAPSGEVVLGTDGSLSISSRAVAATFVVDVATDLADATPGNGTCADANGDCSLRAAIQEANASPGADTITFAIPGSGVPAISTPALPALTAPATLDGTTQAAGRVMITGTSNGTLLTLSAAGCVLRGLAVNGTGNFGLKIQSDDNVVEGNYFGTNADGSALQGGIFGPDIIVSGGTGNRIGGTVPAARNVISGGSLGIRLDGGSGTLIEGNYVGRDATGTLDLGSALQGIRVFTSSGNTIGGATAGAGNLVSGNGTDGISLETAGNLAQGNRVGTDAAGLAPIPNAGVGILVNFSADNVVGGTAPGAGNLSSGNGSHGMRLDANGVVNTLVRGNRIGTNAAGTAAIPNVGHGIMIVGGTGVVIGGTAPGAGNLISGNLQDGIFLTKFVTVFPTGTLIQGNLIGVDATGTVAVPNLQSGIAFEYALGTVVGGSTAAARNVISGNQVHGIGFGGITDASSNPNVVLGNFIGPNVFGTGGAGNGATGVYFSSNARGYEIGGAAAGEANLIAYNAGAGIAGQGLTRLRVRPNSLHSNGGLGVDRGNNGVTPNQPAGPFVLENFPVLTAVSTSAAGTSVSGTLGSGYALAYTVHVFASPTCDSSGYGEARNYLGALTVNTIANTDTPFSTSFPVPIPGGSYVTALAAAPDDPINAGASSELSFCRQVSGSAPPGSVPLEVLAIAPGRGGNTGTVTATITGQGFAPGATVKLARAGQADVAGTNVAVAPEGTSLTAVFHLTGAASGAWDVVVTNPGPASAAAASAFTVEAGTEAAVWMDVLGRGTIAVRAGREETFFFVYGNRGNVDADVTEFRVTIPWQLQLTFVDTIDGARPVVALDRPTLTGGTGETTIHFFVPSLPASSSAALAFRVKAIAAQPGEYGERIQFREWSMTSPGLAYVFSHPPDPNVTITPEITDDQDDRVKATLHVSDGVVSGDVEVEMVWTPATFESAPMMTKTVDGDLVTYTSAVAFDPLAPPLSAAPAARAGARSKLGGGGVLGQVSQAIKGRPEVLGKMLDGLDLQSGAMTQQLSNITAQMESIVPGLANKLIEGNENANVTALASQKIAPLLQNAPDPSPADAAKLAKLQGLMDDLGRQNRELQDAIESLNLTPLDDLSKEERIEKIKEALSTCSAPPLHAVECPPWPGVMHSGKYVVVVVAFDPNEKAGPTGAGEARYVTGEDPLPYTITFENLETASAAAQEVVVTDQLDGTHLDLATFALGPIAFGTRVLDVPRGAKAFTGDVDLRPEIDLIARVAAGFDATTGLATWRFFSLDPATGQPTTDPILGFLPPNVQTPEGEGHISFTISAQPGLASGTEIHNAASIVFDANAPIETADWFNTLDVTAPASQVAALPASSCSAIALSWSGSDAHSGVAEYDIYVSENGGAFELWRTHAKATSGTFYGEVGSTYAFYSVARDFAGNAEAPGGADATTTVGSPSPLVDALEPDSGPATGASVTLTGTGFEAGATVTVGGQAAGSVTVTGPTSIDAIFPALAPGALYDVSVGNASGCSDTVAKGWLADFLDVPGAHSFHDFVEKIVRRGVTAGCSGGNYCVDNAVTRAQMAVFLTKARYHLELVPNGASGTAFFDVAPGSFGADFIEQIAKEGITGGCGNGNYCPSSSVTRRQMAVFLLKSKYGALYVPPPAVGVFADVPANDGFAPWIEQLAAEGITGGCGGGNYCPGNPVTRGQMAVFLSKTFGF